MNKKGEALQICNVKKIAFWLKGIVEEKYEIETQEKIFYQNSKVETQATQWQFVIEEIRINY
jgi:hypothetical protein